MKANDNINNMRMINALVLKWPLMDYDDGIGYKFKMKYTRYHNCVIQKACNMEEDPKDFLYL